ncbi:SRPBCC family protein [Sinomonas mesophila]|uniref:SRPBCC family protein n=1 Tax=Sinomonas mesophila TaxID=1531955 RepID=UPI00098699D6|nr:SRPBCC family protein [Sinomonas mesophila]
MTANTSKTSTASNTVQIVADPGMPYIDMTREFEAPRERVFRAHCDPEIFAKWIGPERLSTTIEHMEARTGGSYRFVQREGEHEYAFRGSFHEVTEPSRVVMTFEFEGAPGNVELDTSTFIALPDGRCRLEIHSTYESVAARDAMLQSGMETGVDEGYRQLDALLASGDA